MIRFKCNGEPYIDPLHKFTIEDWERGEEVAGIAHVMSSVTCAEPLTIETMMAAIEKLKVADYSNNLACFGDYRVQKCEWMKGMDVVVLCGDKAYCWPDGIIGKEVKVIRLPELPKPETELNFKWDFEGTNWNL